MRHPLFLAAISTTPPEPPQGMTHDQAIASPGEYQDAYAAYEQKLRSHNNAALIGWAADANNLLTFADDAISEDALAAERKKILDLFERYGKEYDEFTDNPVIDYGIKILAVVIGLSNVDTAPLLAIQAWLNNTYATYGATDSEKVSEAVKSEEGSS